MPHASLRVVLAMTLIFGACATPRQPTLQSSIEAPTADATYFVISDTHIGYSGMLQVNREMIRALNELPGAPAPAELGGGLVQEPSAVIHLGDATDWGWYTQWRTFDNLYGSDGTDGELRYPLLLTSGNHDRYTGWWVSSAVKERHGGEDYAWTAGGVHFINMGLSPDASGLAWLREHLTTLPASLPLVILFHRTVIGFLQEDWPGDDRNAFVEALRGRHVLAILTGHWHRPGSATWRNFLTVRPGGVRHGARTFMVVRVTDGQLGISLFDWGRWQAGAPAEDCWWTDRDMNAAAPSDERDRRVPE